MIDQSRAFLYTKIRLSVRIETILHRRKSQFFVCNHSMVLVGSDNFETSFCGAFWPPQQPSFGANDSILVRARTIFLPAYLSYFPPRFIEVRSREGAQEAGASAIERASNIVYNLVCIAYKYADLCWHKVCIRRIPQAAFSGVVRQKLPLIWKIMTQRTLIGMLTSSSNTVLEPVTSTMLAGLPDVSAHFGRFRVTRIALSEQALAQFDDEEILAPATGATASAVEPTH
jgi:hypothetical protein